jgi:hypothetical protein
VAGFELFIEFLFESSVVKILLEGWVGFDDFRVAGEAERDASSE